MTNLGFSVAIKNDYPWSFTARNFNTQGERFTTNNFFIDLNSFGTFNTSNKFKYYGNNLYTNLGLDIKTQDKKSEEPQGTTEKDNKTEKTEKTEKTQNAKDKKDVPADAKNNVTVGDNNGSTIIIIGNGNKVVIENPDKPKEPKEPTEPDKTQPEEKPEQKPEQPQEQPQEQPPLEKVDAKVTAKDIELLKKRGADLNHNDKYGKAQFVEGNEVYISGQDKTKPDTIIAKDTTNHAEGNKYTYKKIDMSNVKEAFAKYGLEVDMSQFKEGETYYFLETSENGRSGEQLYNINGAKHLEIYKLEVVQKDDGTYEYNLVQEKGMQGSNRSSISYGKRF